MGERWSPVAIGSAGIGIWQGGVDGAHMVDHGMLDRVVHRKDMKDERGRPLRKPNYDMAHLRARARVHLALGEREKALADAEMVVDRQTSIDGGMSLRSKALDEAEALRDSILRGGRDSAGLR